MQEESINWSDPVIVDRYPSTELRLYVIFLVLIVVVASIRMIRLWYAAPPFRLMRQANNPAYLRLLSATKQSLQQWMGCTLLSWAVFTSLTVTEFAHRALMQKATGIAAFLGEAENIGMTITLTLFIVMLLFLSRWHILRRTALLGGTL